MVADRPDAHIVSETTEIEFRGHDWEKILIIITDLRLSEDDPGFKEGAFNALVDYVGDRVSAGGIDRATVRTVNRV